jgi:hypothetical protein
MSREYQRRMSGTPDERLYETGVSADISRIRQGEQAAPGCVKKRCT